MGEKIIYSPELNEGGEVKVELKRIPVPEFDGEYVKIYEPKGDTYKGENTKSFKDGEFYDEWITNDFSVLKEGDIWHMVGITHPRPKGFKNEYSFDLSDVHEAEYQLFHATAKGKSFKDVFYKKSFSDNEKILYPKDRPGEKPEMWAPHIMKHGGKYQIIYSPLKMMRMVSEDFKKWDKAKDLFTCKSPVARDPYVFEEDGVFYLLYTEDGYVKYRTSPDMDNWSEEKVLQAPLFKDCETESPFMFKRDGIYYLLWCMYDARGGCYDHRTMVFAGETFEELFSSAPITMLNAHAPELVFDEDGDAYLLSVYYPENGISAVKLKWR